MVGSKPTKPRPLLRLRGTPDLVEVGDDLFAFGLVGVVAAALPSLALVARCAS
jgi:hypothetical protein